MFEDKLHCKPLVSIVVLDCNGSHFWDQLLSALAEQSFTNFELIVVENGEPLKLPKRLAFFNISTIRCEENLGFAGGVNRVPLFDLGEFIVLLNNDAIPERDWLEGLVCAAQSDARLGAICSKILFYDRFARVSIEASPFSPREVEGSDDERELGVRVRIPSNAVTPFTCLGTHGLEVEDSGTWVWTKERASMLMPVSGGKLRVSIQSHSSQGGAIATFGVEGDGARTVRLSGGEQELDFEIGPGGVLDVVNNAGSTLKSDWRVAERGLFEEDTASFSSRFEPELCCACSMLIRREAIDGEVFDPEFFAYFEDSDLSLRLKKAGWRLLYEPESVVRHYGSATAGVQSAFQVFHATRNRFWFIANHAPWRVVWRIASGEMLRLGWYGPCLDEEYSLTRLKRETWFGFIKRLWRRLCDCD